MSTAGSSRKQKAPETPSQPQPDQNLPPVSPQPPVRPPIMSAKEIRVNPPSIFSGNREELLGFLQDCEMYLKLNKEIYNSDEKQIIFVLSLLKGGTAAAWKEAFYQDSINKDRDPDYGKAKDFIVKFRTAFLPTDAPGEARAQLRQLRQGKDTTDEYIAQFRILSGRSGISDQAALIEYFMEGLNTGTLQKIFGMTTIPTTIQKWYDAASRFDSQYRRVQEILARKKGISYSPQKKTNAPRYTSNTTTRDPNAMDIDRLTIEQRNQHMVENRCFNCHKVGHRAKDCRSLKQDNNYQTNTQNKFQGIKKPATTARARIQNLVADMDDEEKAKLLVEISDDKDF